MKTKTGKEMRKLMVAVSAVTLALVLAVIAYFMVDVILTTNRNIERNKELVVEESVFTLTGIGDNINAMSGDMRMAGMFNEKTMYEIIKGNWEVFYDFIGDFAINFYPLDYIGIIRGGRPVAYRTSSDFDIDPDDITTLPALNDYLTLDRIGDREGLFISILYPIDLSVIGLEEFQINMIIDRTEAMRSVERFFRDQRNNLVARLTAVSIVAVALSLLITTLVLRHFTRKYVAKPIEELNRTAEDIIAGTHEGEVQVDEDSAYAALQGLLRSGQKVLRRMDEEMRP
ncbi:MAG: hypothetical protein H5T74_13555 [Actinobacteria bacterium]|nr:hypothetical protein [Actinomycetota bacterium]